MLRPHNRALLTTVQSPRPPFHSASLWTMREVSGQQSITTFNLYGYIFLQFTHVCPFISCRCGELLSVSASLVLPHQSFILSYPRHCTNTDLLDDTNIFGHRSDKCKMSARDKRSISSRCILQLFLEKISISSVISDDQADWTDLRELSRRSEGEPLIFRLRHGLAATVTAESALRPNVASRCPLT